MPLFFHRTTPANQHDQRDLHAKHPLKKNAKTGVATSWSARLHTLLRLAVPVAITGLLCQPLVGQAAQVKDRLYLLVPDNVASSDWPVQVWTDSAAEEGIRLELISDSQFLQLGNNAAAQLPGVILPDSAHLRASDPLITAVKNYVNLGGKLMLTYDAGALTSTGFFAPTRSRFSDLVGVDYTLYDTLVDRVVGLGPVVGTKQRLEALGIPPGKYLPYTLPNSSVVALASVGTNTSSSSSNTSAYAPVSTNDPGATQALRAGLQKRAANLIDEAVQPGKLPILGTLTPALGQAPQEGAVLKPKASASTTLPRVGEDDSGVSAQVSSNDLGYARSSVGITAQVSTAAAVNTYAISGYRYDQINYYSYVTQGTFPGKVWLSSPDHGLVAGRRSVGSGSVLFVNMPLGYFKAIGSDSAPLHGFLNAFADEVVALPRLSMQARGIGSLVFNWHVDDGDDLTSDMVYLLDNTRFLNTGPFSIHFTAGRDTVTLGDGRGMSLDTNPTAQALFLKIKNLPSHHQLASHGGWNHDLYGLGVNETNQATYQPWLEMNMAAVDRLKGAPSTEYSAPVGNNPTWAVQWLENRGIQGMYFVGDTGAPSVRSWRNGQRLTHNMWSFPVVPQGVNATFEEFDRASVADSTTLNWLVDLQNFVISHRTNRLFYAHPPGIRGHVNVIRPLLDRASLLNLVGLFHWQTMTDIAQFNNRRLQVNWSANVSTGNSGMTTFQASHPSNLRDVTWLLPKAKYRMPVVQQGQAQVRQDGTHWLVVAGQGTALVFRAQEI